MNVVGLKVGWFLAVVVCCFLLSFSSGTAGTEGEYLVFSQTRDGIYRVDLDGSNNQTLLSSDDLLVYGMDFSLKQNYLFWAEVRTQREIKRIRLNRSEEEPLMGSVDSFGLAWDWINEKLYWTDFREAIIEVYDPLSSNLTVLLNTNEQPTAIVVDPLKGWLYWASITDGIIERASMDGTSRRLIYDAQSATVPYQIYGLTLDYETQTLYWTEINQDTGTIKRSDVNGFNQEVELLPVTHRPYGIVFLRGKLYWAADFLTSSGHTDNLFSTVVEPLGNGSNASELVSNSMIDSPLAIQVISQERQPEARNPCGENNGYCPYLCLLSAVTPAGYSCACPDSVTDCPDVDECALNTDHCNVNAQCMNTEGSFVCTCNQGYTGDGVSCSDVDECALNTDHCNVNAQCMNTEGSFVCTCNQGYTGDGVSCSDVNECALNTDHCNVNAQCMNTEGSFVCMCNQGYTGDGVSCSDVDECALNTDHCNVNAQCMNTEGSFVCMCNQGYTGDGVSCSDVDECALNTDHCNVNAQCMNTEGSFVCMCNQGYTGDGVSCSGICSRELDAKISTLEWPETEIGVIVSLPCPCIDILGTTAQGASVTRSCGGNYTFGAEWMPVDYYSQCGFTDITIQLCNAYGEDPAALSKTVVAVTTNTTALTAADITAAVAIVSDLTQDAIEDETVREDYLRAIDNLIQADPAAIKESQNDSMSSTRLLESLDTFSNHVPVNSSSGTDTYSFTTYALLIEDVNTTTFTGETLNILLGSVDEVIERCDAGEQIDKSGLQTQPGGVPDFNGNATASVFVPMNVSNRQTQDEGVQRLSYSVFLCNSLFQSSLENQSNLTVGSIILTVRVNATDPITGMLPNPLQIRFQASQETENASSILCAQWDADANGGLGAWSGDNCQLIEARTTQSATPSIPSEALPTTAPSDAPSTMAPSDAPSTTASSEAPSTTTPSEAPSTMAPSEAQPTTAPTEVPLEQIFEVLGNQPGHFALLFDLTPSPQVPSAYSFTLVVITYIGLVLSLVCLVAFIVTYLSAKSLRQSQHGQILINMSVALSCLYIAFLIGAHASPVPAICGISAALLQYFMLVFFGWTAAEAIFLYKQLVKVLNTMIPHYVLKAGLIVWLAPLLIVMLSAGPGYEYYYRDDTTFCRAEKYPFWIGLIVPFGVIYVFNWVVFVLIMVSVCKHFYSKTKNADKKDTLKAVRKSLTIAIGLATLFGLGWGFGLAATSTEVEELTFVFQIIFSIFVGLQGVLIFILHGVRKPTARKEWKLLLSKITGKSQSSENSRSTAPLSRKNHSLPTSGSHSNLETFDMPTLTKGGTTQNGVSVAPTGSSLPGSSK